MLSKQELLIALKEQSFVKIEQIIRDKNFNEADLLTIVNDYAALKRIHPQAISLLYRYFNPKREWKTSSTPLLEMYHTVKKVGHVLGLSGKIKFQVDTTKYRFDPEGEYSTVSLQYIAEHLALYQQKYPTEAGELITQAYQFSLSLAHLSTNHYKPNAALLFANRYHEGKLVYLSTGWEGHGIGLGFYGDYLIICNRGKDGDQHHGCQVYKIKNKSKLTEEFFNKLGTWRFRDSKGLNAVLATVIDLDKPMLKFRCKGQRHGTCSYVNAKSIVEALIVLTQASQNPTVNELADIYNTEYKRKKYKDFTRFVRDLEIDELIVNMFYAKDKTLLHFYANLSKEIIRQHHGKGRGFIKDKDELKRAWNFYTRIPEKVKRIINNDNSFVELMKQIKVKHDYIVPPAILSISQWPHYQYVKDSKSQLSYKVNIEQGNIVAINDNPTPKLPFSFRRAKELIPVFG